MRVRERRMEAGGREKGTGERERERERERGGREEGGSPSVLFCSALFISSAIVLTEG